MTVAKTRTLGSIISVSKGKKHFIVDAPSISSKRLLGIDDLRNDNLLRYTDDPSGTAVLPEDVLIAWDGANAGTIGYGKSGYIGSTIARLRISEKEKIFTPFLGSFLKSKFDYLRQTATGATIPHISRKALDDIQLPDVNFHDQIRIAHLLGKVDGLIAQRKQNLQQLDDLLKSVFFEMFGDPVRNEKGWDKPELKYFGKISTGNTPPRNDLTNYDENFIEWIKTDNISNDTLFISPSIEHLSETGAKRGRTVSTGALLVACIAGSVESIGRAALTDRTVAFNQQINAIQPASDINPLYLHGLFKQSRSYIQSQATKGMKKIITKGDFEKIMMIKPPVDLQNKFAIIMEKIESIKSLYKQSLTDLESLYGTLSQKAFSGELDLSRIPIMHETQTEKAGASFSARQQEASKDFSVNEYVSITNLINQVSITPPSSLIDKQGNVDAWLDAYIQYVKDNKKQLDIKLFLQVCSEKWNEQYQFGNDSVTTSLYEKIKERLFEKLRSEKLLQEYDKENIAVKLRLATQGN